MPRIKAYKGNGAIIPVDEAKIRSAFRCPWTKKVFGDKARYVKHLATVRENRMRTRIRHERFMTLKQDLQDQQSFKDIIHWLQLHPEFLWYRNPDKTAKMPDDFWLKVTFLDVLWHKNDKMWKGQIEIQTSHSCNISNMIDAIGIRTGSGGASNKVYGYQVKFFEENWPGLVKMRMWAILQDRNPVAFTEGRSSRYY